MHSLVLWSPLTKATFGLSSFSTLACPSKVMDIGNLLNTKVPRTATSQSSDPTPSQDMSQAQLAQGSHPPSALSPSEVRNVPQPPNPFSPESSALYSPQAMRQAAQYPQAPTPYSDQLPYPQHNLSTSSDPTSSTSQLPPPFDTPASKSWSAPETRHPSGQSQQNRPNTSASTERSASGDTDLPRAFQCSTCQKGFARRSDLVRHGESNRSSSSD